MSECVSECASGMVARVQLGKPLLLPKASSQPLTLSATLALELFGAVPECNNSSGASSSSSGALSLHTCDLQASLSLQAPHSHPHSHTHSHSSLLPDTHTLHFERITIQNNKAFFKLQPPIPSGMYSLTIWPSHVPAECHVLPLVLRDFEICDVLPLRQHIPYITFRPFFTSSTDMASKESSSDVFYIQEERGLTMGSHVWDSAVVVFHRMSTLLPLLLPGFDQCKSNGNTSLIALDLGAGVGLTGLQLARMDLFSNVYLTDLSTQVPQTQRNIDLNGLAEKATATELDWLNESSIAAFLEQHICGRKIALITAADVLYSQILADAFFALVRTLATPGFTVVLLAQKIRGENGKTRIDVNAIPGFNVSLLLQECDVLIYKAEVVDTV